MLQFTSQKATRAAQAEAERAADRAADRAAAARVLSDAGLPSDAADSYIGATMLVGRSIKAREVDANREAEHQRDLADARRSLRTGYHIVSTPEVLSSVTALAMLIAAGEIDPKRASDRLARMSRGRRAYTPRAARMVLGGGQTHT